MNKDNPIKERLLGEDVNAIQFVMDYLQIHFNGIGFTFYVWPTLNINNEVYEFGHIDYRNKLCELIGKTVTDVYIVHKDLLVIELQRGDRIQLNIDPKNPEIISEIAIFWDEDGNWTVFE